MQDTIEISDEERSINQYTYKNLRHQDISSVYNLAEKFKKWMRGKSIYYEKLASLNKSNS